MILSSSSSSSTSSFLLVLLVSSLLLLTPTHQFPALNNEGGDLIDQICRKTPFYDICINTLHSNPLTPQTDLKGIALIMVNDILANATDTLNFIEDQIKQTSDQNLEQALAFCAESYIPVVKYTLPQASDAISQARFGFATYCISDALKDINNCDHKVSALNQSLLGDRNGILLKLVDVAAAILKLLLNR